MQEIIEEAVEKILTKSDRVIEHLKSVINELENMGDQEHNIDWIEELISIEKNRCKYCSDRGCRDCIG